MYAQVIKTNYQVNLIGGEEVGLPIVHDMVICVDLEGREDGFEITERMYYDPNYDKFTVEDPFPMPEPLPEEPTEDEIFQAQTMLNQVVMMEQLNAIEQANAEILLNQAQIGGN